MKQKIEEILDDVTKELLNEKEFSSFQNIIQETKEIYFNWGFKEYRISESNSIFRYQLKPEVHQLIKIMICSSILESKNIKIYDLKYSRTYLEESANNLDNLIDLINYENNETIKYIFYSQSHVDIMNDYFHTKYEYSTNTFKLIRENIKFEMISDLDNIYLTSEPIIDLNTLKYESSFNYKANLYDIRSSVSISDTPVLYKINHIDDTVNILRRLKYKNIY